MAPAFRLASVLFVTSLVCGCASTQITWSRADGKPIDPGQLAVDQTACGGEVQMTDLTGDNDEIELLLTRSREVIMADCMEKRGYMAAR